ncbi:LPXTG cell wall anchor domain-containing protein [Nakamurella silvestris]|nr:LPXTG cell wall anchor domain-containing protein [Nakamurella silvestris]
MSSTVVTLAGSDLSRTGVSGIPTMLVIASIALVLGLAALWLARRRKHRDGR